MADRGLLIRISDRYALASTSLYCWLASELTAPSTGMDAEEERRYESQMKIAFSHQEASAIIQWLRGSSTKYRALFARCLGDQRTSARTLELLTSSKLPFHASGIERAHAGSGRAARRAVGVAAQVDGGVNEPQELQGGWEEGQRYQTQSEGDLVVSILFTDLERSTELLNRLGDEGNQELLHVHNTIVRESVSHHGGTEVKTMGDGFMIVFSNARDAAGCAIDIQRRLHRHNQEHQDLQLKVRIGLNSGEVIKEEEDFFGNAVVLASRVMGHASGGQIIVSDQFRKVLDGTGDFRFVDRSWKRLKGFDVRQHIHELMWRPESP